MNKDINFGKYKLKTFEYVLLNDYNYCEWILKQNSNNKNIIEFKEFIINNKKENKIIINNDNYYNINYNILLDLLFHNNNNFNYYIKIKYLDDKFDNEKKIETYIKQIDDNIIEIILKNTIKSISFICNLTNNIKYQKILEILYTNNFIILDVDNDIIYLINYNIINKFYILYIQNEINDEIYRKKHQPSKINNSYWIFNKRSLTTIGSGKWCLFYDKIIEDNDGLTELDKMYQKIINNYNSKYNIKCSTNLYNPNTIENNTNGVIILYTGYDDKYTIIQEIDKIIQLKPIVYWKSNDNYTYSKNNIKSSNYEYKTNNNKII